MQRTEADSLEIQNVLVRRLRPDDLENVIRIDAKATGQRREGYFKLKLEMTVNETGVEISLAAEIDGMAVGFMIARVYYGDFGVAEPAAVLEVLGVHPDFRGRGVGHALLHQLARAGVARGVRGVGGGYCLVRAPADVAIQDLIDIFEPVPPPDTCMLRDIHGEKCPGDDLPRCQLMHLFQEVDETVRATFLSVSLATLSGA